MAQPCKACAHPERDLMDECLVSGMSNREAGRRFGITKDSVARHRANHVSSALQATVVEQTTQAAQSALARLEDLFSRVHRVLATAERDGKHSLVLQAAREMRQTAEVLAKITGELDERKQVQVLNVTADPGWLAARAAMQEALAPYPDAARAVSARLLTLDEGGGAGVGGGT